MEHMQRATCGEGNLVSNAYVHESCAEKRRQTLYWSQLQVCALQPWQLRQRQWWLDRGRRGAPCSATMWRRIHDGDAYMRESCATEQWLQSALEVIRMNCGAICGAVECVWRVVGVVGVEPVQCHLWQGFQTTTHAHAITPRAGGAKCSGDSAVAQSSHRRKLCLIRQSDRFLCQFRSSSVPRLALSRARLERNTLGSKMYPPVLICCAVLVLVCAFIVVSFSCLQPVMFSLFFLYL